MNENKDEDKSRNVELLNRGMNIEEVKSLLTAQMLNRERAFFKAVYNTYFRAQELLKCNIEDYNKKTGELTALHTKNKYNPKTKKHIQSPPKHALLSPSTMILFKKIIGNRKKGAIFISKKGKRLHVSYLQAFIDELATSVGIQKVTHVTKTGQKYHLVTLQALREAGERHMDMKGADRDVTARGAQHSVATKEKYYKKSGWEEFQEQQKKFHPDFQENW
jgi:site-specific recombinase XerC